MERAPECEKDHPVSRNVFSAPIGSPFREDRERPRARTRGRVLVTGDNIPSHHFRPVSFFFPFFSPLFSFFFPSFCSIRGFNTAILLGPRRPGGKIHKVDLHASSRSVPISRTDNAWSLIKKLNFILKNRKLACLFSFSLFGTELNSTILNFGIYLS